MASSTLTHEPSSPTFPALTHASALNLHEQNNENIQELVQNMTLKVENEQVREQNSHLMAQNDKLKRLCHLCLHLIMADNGSNELSTPQSSPKTLENGCTTAQGQPSTEDQQNYDQINECDSLSTSTAAADECFDSPEQQRKSIDIHNEIDRLISEYLTYNTTTTEVPATSSPSKCSSNNLVVNHFDKLITRIMTAAATGNDQPNDIAQSDLQPKVSKQRKRSLINRIFLKATTLSSSHSNDRSQQQQQQQQQQQRRIVSVIKPASSMISLANANANPILRNSDSIQKLHQFFESQQENHRQILGIAEESAEDSADNIDSQQTVTNSFHLSVAPIKAMNGGIGSPSKTMLATEEHSGTQLSSQIIAQEFVDSAPKMSEVAMFCGLNENPTNPILNAAIRKENEKRQRLLDAQKVKEMAQKKQDEREAAEEEEDFYSGDVTPPPSASPQLYRPRHIFSISGVEEDDYCTQKSDDSSDDSEMGTSQDSVLDEVASNDSGSLIEDEQTMESEMNRLLQRLHQHRWFVLPGEAAANQDILRQLEQEMFDLNNIEAGFQTIHRLWQSRRLQTSRVVFFYEMFSFLFDKYINVLYCDCHQPPCAPSVEVSLFGKLAIPILKQFLKCINPSGHMVIQLELLTAIESLIYNRPHFRPALSEIFHQLFVYGVVESVTFIEWADLQDPSPQFDFAASQSRACSLPVEPITTSSPSKPMVKSRSKSSLHLSNSFPLSGGATSSQNNPTSSPTQQQENLTNRERLFQELKKGGFRLFKCKV